MSIDFIHNDLHASWELATTSWPYQCLKQDCALLPALRRQSSSVVDTYSKRCTSQVLKEKDRNPRYMFPASYQNPSTTTSAQATRSNLVSGNSEPSCKDDQEPSIKSAVLFNLSTSLTATRHLQHRRQIFERPTFRL